MDIIKSSLMSMGLIILACCLCVISTANAAVNQSSYQIHGKVIPQGEDGVHDPENDALEILQAPSDAMVDFPRYENGIIDWMKVFNDRMINPRADISGKQKIHAVDLDIILKNTASMPYVRFPHLPHTKWLACSNCHPDVFIPQKGANYINMSAIMRGQYCGLCHGKVAFPPLECNRCHNVPKEQGGLR
jgi:c(7)-type cytochrome triheme protein